MYDAIVVGARVAGAPTAMLLARKGYNVLLVDRDSFPSDIMSTHYIQLPGKVRLQNWGLLDAVIATGAPFIRQRTLHFDGSPFSIPDLPLPPGVTSDTVCPRRYLLDKILVDAAVESGADLRQNFVARELIRDGDAVVGIRGGHREAPEEFRAKIVIGADGLHSFVAKEVQPEEYDGKPSLTFGYYTYWTGIEDTGMHIYFYTDANGILVFPTNDGKTCIGIGGLHDLFTDFRTDIEGNYLRALERVPALAEQVKTGERERFLGTADMPNYFRKPYGPGWALTGDAGYHRDFLTGLGISDAFLQAELLADALDDSWSGRVPHEEAMAKFQRVRDEAVKPTYDITTKMAAGEALEPMEFMNFGMALMRQIPVLEPA